MTVAMTNLCRVGNLKGFWKTNQGKKKNDAALKAFPNNRQLKIHAE